MSLFSAIYEAKKKDGWVTIKGTHVLLDKGKITNKKLAKKIADTSKKSRVKKVVKKTTRKKK